MRAARSLVTHAVHQLAEARASTGLSCTCRRASGGLGRSGTRRCASAGGQPDAAEDLHRQVAVVALRAAAPHGFALADGCALIVHGIIVPAEPTGSLRCSATYRCRYLLETEATRVPPTPKPDCK